MKRLLSPHNLLVVFAAVVLLPGCFKDNVTKTYRLMKPIYQSKASVLENIRSNEPRALESPGKIFVLGRYLFVNELNKGVHIIDNTDPSNPRHAAFVDIPGNIDIAVKGTTLYADLYKSIVVIDIADPLHAKLIREIPNVFPERHYGSGIDASEYVIVGWESRDTVVDVNIDPLENFPGFAVDNMSKSKGNYVPGLAGSMARFSLVNDYLYTVNHSSLLSFDISEPANPVMKANTSVGWEIETVYPFRDNLFIGSTTGMFIFQLADPANPSPAGSFSHARACDPVIADGNFAYVTLRAGNVCNGTTNQLDIVDISNIQSPSLVKSYQLTNPAGLAKDGNLLFLCDGKDGLKVYVASDVRNLYLSRHIRNVEAYDVIAWNKHLVMVAMEGIYQYDYSDASNIRLLSVLEVKRT